MLLLAIVLAAVSPAQQAHDFRVAHEKEILAEFTELLAIPNLASDSVNIGKNANAIAAMFTRRGANVQLLRLEGAPPLVYATLPAPNAKTTIAFYAHYDGQPVDATQWQTPPWQPVLKNEGGDPRMYARSASDD